MKHKVIVNGLTFFNVYEKGDVVKIVNKGQAYLNYINAYALFGKGKPKKSIYEIPENNHCIVLGIVLHESRDCLMYYVSCYENKEYYLIGMNGVELLPPQYQNITNSLRSGIIDVKWVY